MKTFLKLTPEQAIALRDQLQSMNLVASYPDTLCYHIVYADTTAAKMMRAPKTAKECLAKRRYVFLSKGAVGSILSDSLSELEDRNLSGTAYDAICAAVRRNDGTEIFLHHEELNFDGDGRLAHDLYYTCRRTGVDPCNPVLFNPDYPFRIWRDSVLDGQARTAEEAVSMAGNDGVITTASPAAVSTP